MITVDVSFIPHNIYCLHLSKKLTTFVLLMLFCSCSGISIANSKQKTVDIPSEMQKTGSKQVTDYFQKAFNNFENNLPPGLPSSWKYLTLKASLKEKGRSDITAIFLYYGSENPDYSSIVDVLTYMDKTAEQIKEIKKFRLAVAFLKKNTKDDTVTCMFFGNKTPQGMELLKTCFMRLDDGEFIQVPVFVKDNIIAEASSATEHEAAIFNTFFKNE